MGKLAEIASRVTGDGKEYIKLDEVIEKYPECVTITGIGLREDKEGDQRPYVTFEEDPTKFFFFISGDLGKIYIEWLKEYDDDLNAVNEALQKEYVKMKIMKMRIKNNRTYIRALVLGSVIMEVD